MASHLTTLRGTGLLDSPPDAAFDRLTRLAARLLDASVALVSLVDESRQFFKSSFGLQEPWASRRELPVSHSFCAHVTESGAPLLVSDAREHQVLTANPAISELGVVAYAGVPLVVEGHAIGAFCVIDGKPRTWTEKEVALLTDLAASVVSEIELRVAAKALRVKGEQKYRDLYENAPDMFVTCGLDTRSIADCNRALCEALGYEKDELVGQSIELLYPEDYRRAHHSNLALFEDGAEFADVERRLRRKNGDTLDVSLTLKALRDPEGRITGAFAIYRDITRRKLAERDGAFLLRLTGVLQRCTTEEQIFRAVSGELGIYLGIDRGFFVSVDANGEQGTVYPGYTSDGRLLPSRLSLAALGASSSVAFVANDHTLMTPNVRAGRWTHSLVLERKRAHQWEEREITFVRLVAERAWMQIEHVRVLAQLREREVAAAIERTEERHRVLLEGVKDYAVFMLDPQGRVATWNAGAERLKQYTVREAIGQPYAMFFPEEDVASGRPMAILELASRDGRFEEEGWRVRKDGSRFWTEVIITAIRAADGSLEGFAKIARDATDRRRRDDELAGKHSELMRSLREREVLLQEVHHRVKNNLQVISSLINMQARKLEHGPARAALDECRSRVLTIALIHQNLYQSKDYGRVQFSTYVRTLAGNVLRATGLSPAAVTLDIDVDDIPLGIDRALPCGLIVNELITNALKHAFDNRRGRLRVELKSSSPDTVRLMVSDDGVGLPSTFDIHESRSLGMQLVATLAEQLGGKLVITNEGGACFTITFAADDVKTEAA